MNKYPKHSYTWMKSKSVGRLLYSLILWMLYVHWKPNSVSRTSTQVIPEIRKSAYELQQNNIKNINIVWTPYNFDIIYNLQIN